MQTLTTDISLPPGTPSENLIGDFLHLALVEFKWIKPRRYGFSSFNRHIAPGAFDMSALLSYYSEYGHLCVAAQADDDFILIFPAKDHVPPYTGGVTWSKKGGAALKASWRTAHMLQVAKAMAVLNSPFAHTAVDEDRDQKLRRIVDHGDHQEDSFTVRDYSEGLAGLFWRNFYGPPFVRLFGERLNALPPECVTRLGEELVLVQPYELPTEAGTEAAHAREQQLISLLGPECFYNHEHHRPPTRRPVLPPPPWPAPAT